MIFKVYKYINFKKLTNYYSLIGFLFIVNLFIRSFNNNTFYDWIVYFILFLMITNKTNFDNGVKIENKI